jgi:hypothetical protein
LLNLQNNFINLSDEIKKSKLSIITISFSSYSTSNSEEWLKNIEEIKKNYSNNLFNFDIVVINGFQYKFFKKIILNSFMKKTMKSRLNNTFITFEKLNEDKLSSLGITNLYTNYLFLIDNDLKIRWKCSGINDYKDIKKLKSFCEKLFY